MKMNDIFTSCYKFTYQLNSCAGFSQLVFFWQPHTLQRVSRLINISDYIIMRWVRFITKTSCRNAPWHEHKVNYIYEKSSVEKGLCGEAYGFWNLPLIILSLKWWRNNKLALILWNGASCQCLCLRSSQLIILKWLNV